MKNFLLIIKIIILLLILETKMVSKGNDGNVILDPYIQNNPKLIINSLNNPEPGYIFVGMDHASMGLMDNYGNSIDTSAFKLIPQGFGLSLQMNGYLTYYEAVADKYFALNSSFQIVDSFSVPSPYENDMHDFILNADGSYYMIGTDTRTYDMSKIVNGGESNASVIGCVVLEFDRNKNLIWKWNTWDHFKIEDATADIDLTKSVFSYSHINSIDIDPNDGNLVISNRHMDEVTKINISTGDIMWRLGGDNCKNNQFTFINDTYKGYTGFSHQHGAKMLPNGNLILFDNGNNKPFQASRAVEYSLNITNKIATKVWEFYSEDNYFTKEMGNVQRLPNGNTLINFCSKIYEVTKNNKLAYYSTIDHDNLTYRAFKNVLNLSAISKNITKIDRYDFNESNNKTDFTLNLVSVSNYGRLSVEKHNYKPETMSFVEFIPSKILNYRWVISGEIKNIASKLSINTQDLSGFNKKDTFVVYIRDGENRGNFTILNTTFNANTNTLETSLNKSGEIIIANNKSLPSIAPFLKFPLTESLFKNDSILIWNSTLGADKYRIQISQISDFSSILIDTMLSQLSYNFNSFENGRKYYWRVCAYNMEFDYYGPWSSIWDFRTFISTPIPLIPINNTTRLSYTNGRIKWSNIKYATNYALEIAEDSIFKNIEISRADLIDTSYFYQTLKPFIKYYWRVASINGDGITNWSAVLNFKTDISIPKLISPENKSNGIDINGILNYEKPNEADFFEYQLSRYFEFSNIEQTGFTSRTQNTKFVNIASFTKYFWRVRSIHETDTSDWSDIYQFTTQISIPKLSYPLNFATNELHSISLTWNDIKGANSYDVYLSETSDFNQSRTFSNLNSKLPLIDLKPLQDYYWKVRANYNGGNSNWSDIWKFKTAPSPTLDKPNLLLPNNSTIDLATNVELAWLKVSKAEKYRVQVSQKSNFDEMNQDSLTQNTELLLLNLDNETTYYWRVQAQSSDAVSLWSEVRNFTIGGKSIPSFPFAIYPKKDEILNNSEVIFKWNPVTNAIEYGIFIADDYDFKINNKEYNQIKDTIFKIKLLDNKTYYWKLYCKNIKLQSLNSPVLKFRIENNTNIVNDISDGYIILFPNPVVEKLKISSNIFGYDTKVIICNILGQQIKFLNFEKSDFNNIEINCNDMSNGVYSITIYNQNIIKVYYFVKY